MLPGSDISELNPTNAVDAPPLGVTPATNWVSLLTVCKVLSLAPATPKPSWDFGRTYKLLKSSVSINSLVYTNPTCSKITSITFFNLIAGKNCFANIGELGVLITPSEGKSPPIV